MEIWKDVKNYEGLYQVSSLGRVKGLERQVRHPSGVTKIVREKIISQHFDRDGYPRIALWKNNKGSLYAVHRLVASAFLPNPNNSNLVMHLDDNPLNNKVDNLIWGTTQDNTNDKVNKGRQAKGETIYQSKLTEKEVLIIRSRYTPRVITIGMLSEEFNVGRSAIKDIVSNKTWKHLI